MMNISDYLSARKSEVEKALGSLMLDEQGVFSHHIAAMRYSLFVGGKRIRPILCLAAAEAVTDNEKTRDALLPVACALECIHTYSLIHDDLPAMDNDDLRRGKPTSHKKYGEAAAILAGDGLLTFAFELLSHPVSALADSRRLRIIQIIARAAGPEGMVGGQFLDISNENQDYPFELLKTIHKSKTGALIAGSILSGAIGAGADAEQEKKLGEYGILLGLAFQIVDDLLDATATTTQLGKTAGSDRAHGKVTYPAFFGIEQTRKKARETVESAKATLSSFGNRARPLIDLADYIYMRTH